MSRFLILDALGGGQKEPIAVTPTPTPTPSPTPTPPPTPPSATALPKQSSIVMRMSAAALSGLADGAKVPAWNSTIGTDSATQTDSSKQPVYRAAGAKGKPCVEFASGATLTFPLSGAAGTTVASGVFAVQLVVQNSGASSSYGVFLTFGGYDDFNIILPLSNSFYAGTRYGGGTLVPVDDLGFMDVGVTKGGATNRSSVKSTMGNAGTVLNGAASGVGTIGGCPGVGTMAAQVSEIIVWSVPLEQPDMIQFTKWAHEQHALPYAWAALGKYRVWDGNSTHAGFGTTGTQGSEAVIPMRVAKKRGWNVGTYTFIGSTGRSQQQMIDDNPTRADPCVALLTGATPILVTGEYANESAATANVSDMLPKVAAHNTARKAAGWYVVFQTASDIADNNTGYKGDPTRMATYNNFCANLSQSKADAVVTLHLDPNVGISTACPNEPGPYGPNFSDVVHLTDQGSDYSASYYNASSALP